MRFCFYCPPTCNAVLLRVTHKKVHPQVFRCSECDRIYRQSDEKLLKHGFNVVQEIIDGEAGRGLTRIVHAPPTAPQAPDGN